MKPTWKSASRSSAISAANVPGEDQPGRGDHAAGPLQARRSRRRACSGPRRCSSRIRVIRKMLSSTPSATRKMKQKIARFGSESGWPNTWVKISDDSAERERERQDHGADQVQRRDDAAQQRDQHEQDQDQHQRDDQLRVAMQRLQVVVVLGREAADQHRLPLAGRRARPRGCAGSCPCSRARTGRRRAGPRSRSACRPRTASRCWRRRCPWSCAAASRTWIATGADVTRSSGATRPGGKRSRTSSWPWTDSGGSRYCCERSR